MCVNKTVLYVGMFQVMCVGRRRCSVVHALAKTWLPVSVSPLNYPSRASCCNRPDSQQVISVWHDIPLYVRDESEKCTGHLNFVCEIPRCSRKKFEIATDEVGNPIKQDTKKGLLREFKKVFRALTTDISMLRARHRQCLVCHVVVVRFIF